MNLAVELPRFHRAQRFSKSSPRGVSGPNEVVPGDQRSWPQFLPAQFAQLGANELLGIETAVTRKTVQAMKLEMLIEMR
jgi:hypothetical protein